MIWGTMPTTPLETFSTYTKMISRMSDATQQSREKADFFFLLSFCLEWFSPAESNEYESDIFMR